MAEPRKVFVGRITKYYEADGNGFIMLDNGQLVYFTKADIAEEGPLEVREDRTVTFTIEEQRDLRPRARNIAILD